LILNLYQVYLIRTAYHLQSSPAVQIP
jgi:hypothetical protein